MLDKLIALLKGAATTTTTETHDGVLQIESKAFIKLNGEPQEINAVLDIPWAVIEDMLPGPGGE